MAAPRPCPDARTGAPGRSRLVRRSVAATGVAGALAALITGCGQVPQDDAAVLGAETPAPTATSSPAASTSARPPGRTGSAAAATSSTRRSPAPEPSGERSVTPAAKTTEPRPKHSASASTAPTAILVAGDHGSQVRELQARLRQLHWFSGKVTGHYGPVTTGAVRAFQAKHGLAATGRVDRGTWARLVAMTQQPTRDELDNVQPAGPAILAKGDSGRQVEELQARLTQLDWFAEKITGYYGDVTAAAVRGFQGKRGLPATGAVDRRTWDRLVAMSHEPTTAELSGSGSAAPVAAAGLDPRCLTGRAMCIDKTTDQLVWVIDGKPQLRFDVRFGADTSPTREGSFNVGWKARDWVSTIYHSAMPYSMFFSGGQAVHYSSDFAARGYAGASHGCVNVRDLNGLRTLFHQVKVGDKVIVYRS